MEQEGEECARCAGQEAQGGAQVLALGSVNLWGREGGRPRVQHGHVVPQEEDPQPLPEVAPHLAQLPVGVPGELQGQAADGVQG